MHYKQIIQEMYFNDLLFNSAVGSDSSEHNPYKT